MDSLRPLLARLATDGPCGKLGEGVPPHAIDAARLPSGPRRYRRGAGSVPGNGSLTGSS